MDTNRTLQSYEQLSVSSGTLLESRAIRPKLDEQPTRSQWQPNENIQGTLEETEEERQRKRAEQMVFNRRYEPEDKRKKRLAAQAERASFVKDNPSNVVARDAASVASIQEAGPEVGPLQRLSGHGAFSDQSLMVSFIASTAQRLSTSADERSQHIVSLSAPHLNGESACEPLPSTSAYIPLKDLTVQPSHVDYAPLTPDPALRASLNGASENNLDASRLQSLPPYENENMDEYETMEHQSVTSASRRQNASPTQRKAIAPYCSNH
ncbi:unnamed protein product [Cylicocyclus nassatus]|uniref:Uncharacterized protein n=1 Tax=Cylicocyclus nassatus TaxID=53992 RepID=A0AA36GE31_CYLNA|nr:unnamed protein product [Cylicocyclus nassatus]